MVWYRVYDFRLIILKLLHYWYFKVVSADGINFSEDTKFVAIVKAHTRETPNKWLEETKVVENSLIFWHDYANSANNPNRESSI